MKKSFKDYLIEENYWIPQAGGTVFYAQDTGRILFVKRSAEENEGEKWDFCVGGGKDETDPDIRFTVDREVGEEVGKIPKVISSDLIDIFTDVNRESGMPFTYYTYFTVLSKEFVPKLSWEHTSHMWRDINNDKLPEPLHFGTKMLMDTIKRRMPLGVS